MKRLGLIGPGRHGKRYLMPENGGRRIRAVLHRSDPGFIVGWHGGKTSNPELFWAAAGDWNFDGVIIATPPASHRTFALAAIERGLPVLVEKPLALTWEDCSAIIDAAESAGVPLLVGHTHLFAQEFEQYLDHPWGGGMVQIGGPTSGHDYEPAIDWGSHGVAMLLAMDGFRAPNTWGFLPGLKKRLLLGSNRTVDILGADHPKTCKLIDRWGGVLYVAQNATGTATPMARMLDVFCNLIDGGWDRRADYNFARDVYRVLLTECDNAGSEKSSEATA